MGLTECRCPVHVLSSIPNPSPCRDIDFEYPVNGAEGQGLLYLMTSIRNAFDDLAIANGDTTPYELTVSSELSHATWITTRFLGRSVSRIPKLCILSSPAVGPSSHVLEFDGAADFVSLVHRGAHLLFFPCKAYDYAGSWLTFVLVSFHEHAPVLYVVYPRRTTKRIYTAAQGRV